MLPLEGCSANIALGSPSSRIRIRRGSVTSRTLSSTASSSCSRGCWTRRLSADAWGRANLPRTARFLSEATGVPLAGTLRFLDRRTSGPVTVLKPSDIADQQRVADAFSRAGLIPKPPRVADAVWQP